MQGPEGNHRRRTAGEHRGPDGTGGQEVRDWQRNTWYGPAPVNLDPFDEPPDAPELRRERSANVNEHTGAFWQQHQAGYSSKPQETTTPKRAGDKRRTGTETGGQIRTKTEKPRSRWKKPLILLLVFTAAFLILRFGVFSIREIRVTGNQTLSSEEVIATSGIHLGDGILSLNSDQVEQRINANWRLRFRYLHKDLPGTVTIAVKERETCCWLIYCGILYTMDKNGVVTYESEDTSVRPALVQVKGLDIRSGCALGQTIVLNSAVQQLLFREIFLEMKVLKCSDLIEEVDLSNPSSILLMTREGITVSLGDYQNLHAKLRSMLLVREAVLNMNYQKGSINVSNPVSPFYSPGELIVSDDGT